MVRLVQEGSRSNRNYAHRARDAPRKTHKSLAGERVPQDNHDPIRTSAHRLLREGTCPKCGAEMEPIDNGPEGPPLEDLQLCPDCYLVMWTDEGGIQVRQGVPMKKDTNPISDPAWLAGEAKKC